MTPDVTGLIEFYRSPLGGLARRAVRKKVQALAIPAKEKRILGLGFATPYLRNMLADAERIISAMPARQGASIWPRESLSTTILCDPMELPLADASVDLIVAVHAFEFAADAEELMRELWRVTAPHGQLLVVVPRRNGLWAARDNTPFGHGHPYSVGQLDQLLRTHSFEPNAFKHALYMLPSQQRLVLQMANFFEKTGPISGPALSGVICASATKQQYPAIARRKKAERYIRVPVLAPQAAFEGSAKAR